MSDLLIASLLPSARTGSFPAKLHHLSLTRAKPRVEHAVAQLDILKTELESREAVGTRYVNNVQRRTREMVLRGLMEAIRQELIALKRAENGSDGENGDDDGRSSSGRTIRVIRSPNGNGPNSPRSPGSSEDDGQEQDEEEDELVTLEKKINESTMPPDARLVANREMKRLKSIPPQSVEHGGIRNYLDWLTDLPWGTSSYDVVDQDGEGDNGGRTIDKDFLERARLQLVSRPQTWKKGLIELNAYLHDRTKIISELIKLKKDYYNT